MANVDQNKTVKYWTEGTSSSQIKGKNTAQVQNQLFWYNGSADGFLTGSLTTIKSRSFAILVGF